MKQAHAKSKSGEFKIHCPVWCQGARPKVHWDSGATEEPETSAKTPQGPCGHDIEDDSSAASTAVMFRTLDRLFGEEFAFYHSNMNCRYDIDLVVLINAVAAVHHPCILSCVSVVQGINNFIHHPRSGCVHHAVSSIIYVCIDMSSVGGTLIPDGMLPGMLRNMQHRFVKS